MMCKISLFFFSTFFLWLFSFLDEGKFEYRRRSFLLIIDTSFLIAMLNFYSLAKRSSRCELPDE